MTPSYRPVRAALRRVAETRLRLCAKPVLRRVTGFRTHGVGEPEVSLEREPAVLSATMAWSKNRVPKHGSDNSAAIPKGYGGSGSVLRRPADGRPSYSQRSAVAGSTFVARRAGM
jgi:hypothetical protein